METDPTETFVGEIEAVSPNEVMASEITESVEQTEAEIARLEAARQAAYSLEGKDSIDPTALGEEDGRLAERIRQLKIQLAEMQPVTPEPEDE